MVNKPLFIFGIILIILHSINIAGTLSEYYNIPYLIGYFAFGFVGLICVIISVIKKREKKDDE